MDTVKETKKAIDLATGKRKPKKVSVVNNVTEYGALFNRLNEERAEKGLDRKSTRLNSSH